MTALRTILHPTDFSDSAESAFQLASSLARDYGARLIALHVVTPPMTAYGGVMTPPPPPADYRQDAEEKLQKVRSPDDDVHIERRLLVGEPVDQILSFADEVNCDLIVVGTHGRTGFRRLLMGSVAEQILRRAACPVLTVKTPLPRGATSSGSEVREANPIPA